MKLIYALPLAVAAVIAVSGCSKNSENSAPADNQPAMQNAPSSAEPSQPNAIPAHPQTTPAPASSSSGAMSSKPGSTGSGY